MTYMRTLYRRHYAFNLLFLLFVSFRLLAILLFRPGGFITDFSDYDFYYTWGTLIPMGYHAYDNLWTAYPPLFPAVMLTVFEASSRIPPWVEPRLAFHVLFGLTLLLFESGSFVLIYRLGNRLGADAIPAETQALYGIPILPGLIPAVLYALFFVPVYTLIGWFEPMPLFFMLLGLDLLLVDRAWGWPSSAMAAGLGFLTKLTPMLLVPIAIRWLGVKLSWRALRDEWFNRNSPGNIARASAYVAIFFAVVIAVGYPFVRANPALAFSSFRVQSIRPPWQSVWAILDGFYGYGLVPLDMRNLGGLSGLSGPLWETRLPWAWIGLAFIALYLWLYTRRYDWHSPRTPITFSAVSILLLFLYSKGWSPQFLLWVLVYIALFLPTLRGVVLAIALSLINFVEADVFLILLPDEHWLMAGTVLARSALLILLVVEFLGQIWPSPQRGAAMRRISAYVTWAVIAGSIVAAVFSLPRAAQAYQDRRLAEHPCAEAIAYLRAQPAWPTETDTDTIITQQSEVWRDLYPWLRTGYDIHVLDGYSPDQPPGAIALNQLDELLAGRGRYSLLVDRTQRHARLRHEPASARDRLTSTVLRHISWRTCSSAPARSICLPVPMPPPPSPPHRSTVALSASSMPMWVPRKWAAACPWCYTGRVTHPSTPAIRFSPSCWTLRAISSPSRITYLYRASLLLTPGSPAT